MGSTLCNPQDDRRKHETYTLGNIGVAVVRELLGVSVEDVLQDQQALQPYRLSRANKITSKNIPRCPQAHPP